MEKSKLTKITNRLIEIRPLKDEDTDEYRTIIMEIYGDGSDFTVFSNLLQGLIDESVDFNRNEVDNLIFLIESFSKKYIDDYIFNILNNYNLFFPHAKNIFRSQIMKIINREDTRNIFIRLLNKKELKYYQQIKDLLFNESLKSNKPKNKYIDYVLRAIS